MQYPRRANRDGTLDSICPRCYVTIGTSNWAADLDRLEAAHVCDPWLLEHFHPQRRPIQKQPLEDRSEQVEAVEGVA